MAIKFLDSAGLTYFINKIVYGITSPKFSTRSTYAVGNFVIYTGKLYRCTTAITVAEAWNAAHWTATTAAAELAAINSNISHIGEIDYSYPNIGTPIGTTGQTYTITRAGTKLIVFAERIDSSKELIVAINGTVIMEQYNNSSTLQSISLVFAKNLSVGDTVKFYTDGAAYASVTAQVISLN